MSDINNPYGQAPPPQPYSTYGDPDKRPGSVTAASVISIVLASIGALLFGLVAVGLIVARGDLVEAIADEVGRQPGFEDLFGR